MKQTKQAKKHHRFVWNHDPTAKEVSVAGTFNGWTPMPLKKTADRFQASIELPTGEHEYKFIVDGAWQHDPAASESKMNAFGSMNSVVSVE